ncbi:MAG: cell division protein ZapA [Clostridia bacterium]|nr:cell division protein ZapA [Clostridia bacterium]
MDSKQRTTVYVLGKEYTLLSPDGPEHMQRVASYADRMLRETQLSARMTLETTGILTALSLADEVLKAKDENTRLRRRLREAEDALESLGVRAEEQQKA